ncbi:MAG: XdhC family protein [Rhodocyclaceae bacterium]|nr:XdhC family protein [Rhodocyclaceae bacterium]MBX3669915.1 XdhC family protein [Rhodocyclaceae bacterium]
MDSVDKQVLDAARRWSAAGHRYTLFTVARTWGSAPRPPGAWMILREDGLVQGSVSGGCVEDDLIRRMLAGEFREGAARVVRYGQTDDEARRFGLPCGGTLELAVEPAPDAALLETLARHIAAGQLTLRVLDLADGSVRIEHGARGDPVAWDGRRLSTPHGPGWRLLMIGAVQIARFLAHFAQALDFEVLVCDPRTEYTSEWNLPATRLVPGMPDDVVLELNLDPASAVVALTHDPKLDDMALLEALKSAAFYVGALGSRANNEKRIERLRRYFGLSDAELARLHGPVGLPLGSRTPPEIALAIMAEITAAKNGVLAANGLLAGRSARRAGVAPACMGRIT